MFGKAVGNMCPHVTMIAIMTPTVWIAFIYLLTVSR